MTKQPGSNMEGNQLAAEEKNMQYVIGLLVGLIVIVVLVYLLMQLL
jgi:flagellar biogenesis protein FliO